MLKNDKGYRADHAYTMIEAINLSPPIGSKLEKFTQLHKHISLTKRLYQQWVWVLITQLI